ncbi:hypothetical protein A2U01_0055665, partial [Trifolium medium]|nr:hypothetical protein [Trifolium medium]
MLRERGPQKSSSSLQAGERGGESLLCQGGVELQFPRLLPRYSWLDDAPCFLERPYPRGEECGLAFCFAMETVESVKEQDLSGGCCLDEEKVSRTCGVSVGKNENCSSEDV